MKFKYILTCLSFFIITSTAFAQKAAYIIVSKEEMKMTVYDNDGKELFCLLYTSPSPRDTR